MSTLENILLHLEEKKITKDQAYKEILDILNLNKARNPQFCIECDVVRDFHDWFCVICDCHSSQGDPCDDTLDELENK